MKKLASILIVLLAGCTTIHIHPVEQWEPDTSMGHRGMCDVFPEAEDNCGYNA